MKELNLLVQAVLYRQELRRYFLCASAERLMRPSPH